MTQEAEVVLMIRGSISTLDPEMQSRVQDAYNAIMQLSVTYGPEAAGFAIALRGAEMAAAE